MRCPACHSRREPMEIHIDEYEPLFGDVPVEGRTETTCSECLAVLAVTYDPQPCRVGGREET